MTLVAGLGAALPLATMHVLDHLVPIRHGEQLFVVLIALGVAQGARPLLSFAADYCFALAAQSVQVEIREELFRHVLHLPLAFFDARQSGYLAARINEVGGIAALFSPQTIVPLLAVLELPVSGVLMAYVSWKLTVVVVFLLPCVYLISRCQAGGIRVTTGQTLEQAAVVTRHMHESLSGVQTIKEHRGEARASQKISDALRELLRTSMVQSVVNSLTRHTVDMLEAVVGVVVLALGIMAIREGSLTLGGYVAFSMCMSRFLGPARSLVALRLTLDRAWSGLLRLSELTNHVREDGAGLRTVRLPRVQSTISFRDIHFAYDAPCGCEALKGVTLDIKAAERLAIVGPSGCGKTTLVRLLVGLYQPNSGQLLIDDRNLNQIHLGDLRDRIGIVSQHPFFFDDTVSNNILYSRPGATREDVHAAAQAADAEGFILRLPAGYETVVGERGVRLSGGQKQRISIARALLKNPDVIIFDEATAHLDPASERRIWRAVELLFAGRTCIIVSHRLDAAAKADRVVFMRDGRIVASGTHSELLARLPQYYEWCMLTTTLVRTA